MTNRFTLRSPRPSGAHLFRRISSGFFVNTARERPRDSSPLNKEKRAGTFVCAGCGQPLFTADTKYKSGTGWPSFFRPLQNAVATTVDRSHFMTRTEVHCSSCGGHLGHLFPDGPAPTGERYCMNGVSLRFEPEPSALKEE